MYLRHGLGGHISFGKSRLHEGDGKYRVTSAAHVVHVCAGGRPVRVTPDHVFLDVSNWLQFFFCEISVLFHYNGTNRYLYIGVVVDEVTREILDVRTTFGMLSYFEGMRLCVFGP